MIKEFLDRYVPEFSYVVSVTGPVRDDTFIVAPVVNVDAVGEAPPSKRLAEIRAFVGRPGGDDRLLHLHRRVLPMPNPIAAKRASKGLSIWLRESRALKLAVLTPRTVVLRIQELRRS